MKQQSPTVSLYIDLIQKCLTNQIYAEMEYVPIARKRFRGLILDAFEKLGVRLVRTTPYNSEARIGGNDWPAFAHTMIGIKRLENLRYCVETVLSEGVPGDFIETGVWRGGACILMRAILKAYESTDRVVWVADSFEGLPPPNVEKYPIDSTSKFHLQQDLAVSIEQVQSNFEVYGLLDDQVKFLKGWFSDTLPNAPIEKLAVLRLDGDIYESTIDALNNLYPKLSVGGFVIVDDYCINKCRKAIHDYRDEHQIDDEIVPIDDHGVYWKRIS